MLMAIPVSFLIMTSAILNGYSVNNRNAYADVDNKTASLTSPIEGPDSANITNAGIIMKQLLSSNKPYDIATLAYIWGYPLVTSEVTKAFVTNPNVPAAPGRGPANQFNHLGQLTTAKEKDIVRPNADTLYSYSWIDLKGGPIVLKVPNIVNRYYTLQFLDAYSNSFHYIGTRTTGEKGGTFLITGPNWKGTLPANYSSMNMSKIQSPTNIVFLIGRILVNGPQDVTNVNQIQKNLTLTPVFHNTTRTTSEAKPIEPLASNIPKLGIQFFDILSKSLVNNPPPANQTYLIKKFETIGIGLGKTPSNDITNQTIIQALKTGISEGEKIIDEKTANIGTVVNGWSVNLQVGTYGEDYLLRAAVAKVGFGANIPQEAVYPLTFTDANGTLLNAANNTNYLMHFGKGQVPPVKGFWSLTMYDKDGFFVDNPINRYNIGDRTLGLKNNTDSSLDISISSKNPGQAKESNWLPAPDGPFTLLLRMYIPDDSVVKGQYQIPPVEKVVTNK